MDFEHASHSEVNADHEQALHPQAAALAAKGKAIHPGRMHHHIDPVQTVTPNAQGVVVLPAGTDINQIEVDGRNLVVHLPNGTDMLIVDGAVFVPQLVVGDVEIPSVNLAALLIGEEPQPAAGPPRSSGGNFAGPDGNVGDPHGLGDLLPPTELRFTQSEEREILPFALERNDTASVVTAAATGPDATVYEAGLATGSLHDGSNVTTGSFTVSASDGIASIGVGGVSFTLAQMQAFATTNGVVTTAEGTLRLTGYNAATGVVSYSYTLNVPVDNAHQAGATGTSFDDSIHLTVTGVGGTSGADDLVVRIIDDTPQAVDDTGHVVTEDGAGAVNTALTSTVSGNVLANDVSGADTPMSFVSWSSADAAVVSQLNLYGTLTQNADGSWSYQLDNSRAATQALSGSFSQDFTLHYTMQDADGDQSSAKLVITVHGADDTASVVTAAATGPDATVYEAGLATGSLHDGSNVTTGSFTVSASDGIASIGVGGVSFTLAQMQAFATTNGVVTTAEGTLRLTGYNAATGVVSYSYTLNVPVDNAHQAGATGTSFDDSIHLTVTGVGGTSGADDLVVRIIDDTPQAVDDTGHVVTEDGAGAVNTALTSTVSGNVLANDVSGADTPMSFVSWSSADAAVVSQLNLYGTLTQNADGSWSYQLDNSRAATQALSGSFSQDFTLHYTMQDADGDQSSAKLVITVHGADDTASVVTAAATGPDATVYEAGLATGSLHDGSNVTTGSFTVSASDGIASIGVGGVSFTLAQMQAFATTNGVVTTAEGTLRLTGYNAATGVVSYSYTLNVPVDNAHQAGATGTSFDDSIHLTVTGVGGTSGADDLVVRIIDDTPQAVDDTGHVVTEDGAGAVNTALTSTVSGNVLANDVSGADTPMSFVSWSSADAAVVSQLNLYGTLTQNADGSWSYQLDNSRAATQALSGSFSQDFTLHYTMQDADGDQSSAKLVITVHGADDTASVVTAAATGPDATVYEAGLATGSLHDGSNVTTGSFTVSASDGIASIGVGGVSFTLAQMQAFATTNGVVTTAEGTLRLTGYNAATGVVSYSYTLNVPVDNAHQAGATGTSFDDSIHLTVTGVGGTSGADDLVVRIIDDTPQAVDDTGHVVTEDGAGAVNTALTSTVSGNVLANDVSGADTPMSFVSWSSADAAVVSQLNLYGTLTQNADGSWSYQLDNSRAATQALSGSFSQDFTLHYTMQDADGDQSSAKLVITVHGADDTASVVTAAATGPDATVYEAGLATGSLHDGSNVTTGSFTVSASDGIASIGVGGVSFTLAQMQAFATTNGVVTTAEGTLRLTGYNAATGVVSYSYTLNVPVDNAHQAGATGTSFDDSIHLTVTGVGGTSGADDLVVRIIDDTPQAVDDTGHVVTEDGAGAVNTALTSTVSGNVLANDVSGADTPMSFVSWSSADAAVVSQLNLYGTLTQNADGSWSYQLDNSRAATQALSGSFSQDFTLHYTMQDADGDQSSAKLVITVHGADDTASVVTAAATGPDATVYEAGLATGSLHDGSNVTTGSFTVSASDGIASIGVGGVSFTLAQMQAFATTNGVVTTAEGTLRLTGYNAATGVVSYSYTLNVPVDNAHQAGATGTSFDDSIHLTVTGVGGTSGADDLVVRIIDDTPSFGQVQSQQTDNIVGSTYVATGTLHFTPGADSFGSVTNITSSTTATSGGHSLVYSLSGNVLTAYQDTNNNGVYDAVTDATKVFTLTANPTATPPGQPSTDHAGTYTFQLLTPLDPTVTNVAIGGSSGFGAGPKGELQFNGSTASQHLAIVDGWSTTASTLAGAFDQSTWTQQAVNGATAGFGVNNNNLDAGELFIADFHAANAPGITVPTGQSNTFGPQIAFATFTFPNFGATDKIYYQAHYEDGTTGAVTLVDSSKFASGVTITAPAGEYLDYIVFYDQSGSGKFLLTNTGTVSSTVNQQINFTVSASDGDGDVATSSTFHVTVATGQAPSSAAAPVVLDLNGDGVQFVPISAGMTFDYQNNGHPLATAWAGVGDGVLALQNGSGYQVVFGSNGLSDLQGLAATYDTNHDGVLNVQDANWSQFGALVTQANGGEVFETLSQLGITSIKLTSNGVTYGAANGEVTVVGESSFTRTDGTQGTAADAVFATTSVTKTSESTTETANSGLNQALLAASLVAAVGASETHVDPQPAPAAQENAPVVTETAPASTATAEPATTESKDSGLAPADDQSTHQAEQPAPQASHASEEPAPDHAQLSGGGAAHAPAADTAQTDQPSPGDHQGLLAQSINLPAFDGNAAAVLAAAAHGPAGPAGANAAAEVVKEALGTHDAPNIDALLAALPGGAHPVAPVLLNPVATEAVDSGHLAAAAAIFHAAMAAHEAMAVAHG
ncbi:VCBS domain-containing protein [Sphingobium sp. EM0848]|uniref:VCBS domain-containing protein n=1 Tax=Sphingobium sp. EM0848 TaxID=2743473 RepID=UPI00159C346B|nr:VCBS domain-containing protein [Sphingobium sp. EM0848]